MGHEILPLHFVQGLGSRAQDDMDESDMVTIENNSVAVKDSTVILHSAQDQ
jgi:hypothetical protein